ncbi:D-mannonate oxidoreductase [Vibrio ishigakensis]|uniref:D-mannonate oxidoreductase n=1 Tax=Vibrio ishigakensis TaxID=1481914 RepID=A0A0B8Q4M5_9VIBR|nr:D-mannonate oxidoreductase [Vibrio ishigakensis]
MASLGVAGWMRYVSGVNESGEMIDVRDPMLEEFKSAYSKHGLNKSVVNALLSLEAIFGEDLIKNEQFVTAVTDAYELLLIHGARKAVASL